MIESAGGGRNTRASSSFAGFKDASVPFLAALLMGSSLVPAFNGMPGWAGLGLFGGALVACLTAVILALQKEGPLPGRVRALILAQGPVLAALALYLSWLWISAFKTGWKPVASILFGSTAALLFIHLVLPLGLSRRDDLTVTIRVLAVLLSLAAAASLILGLAKMAFGLDFGIVLTSDLYLEKKEMLRVLGLPFIVRGIYSHSQGLGMMSVLAIPVFLAWKRECRTRIGRRCLVAAIVVGLAAVLVSMSVIAAVSAAAAFLLFRTARAPAWRRSILAVFIAVVLFFNFAVILKWDMSFLARLPITSKGRIMVWNIAIPAISQRCVFGWGAKAVTGLMPFHFPAHNAILETGLGSGLPAMWAYSFYLILLLLRFWRIDPSPLSQAVLGIFLIYVFMQFFESIRLGSPGVLSFPAIMIAVPYIFAVNAERQADAAAERG